MSRRYMAAIPVRTDGRRQNVLYPAETDPLAGIYQKLQEVYHNTTEDVQQAFQSAVEPLIGELEALVIQFSGNDHYSNKGGHKERSIANDRRKSGGHNKHWKKEDKKQRERGYRENKQRREKRNK